MKKTKKIRYKRRLIIYSALTFLVLFSIVDYYFETFGLPDNVAATFQEKLKDRGLDITFDEAKLGVINGLVLTNPLLQTGESEQSLFKAEKLRIGFSFSPFETYGLGIGSFEIEKGNFKIPLFPETGREGIHDLVEINQVDADISFSDNQIDVEHFSGSLDPFHLTAAGSLKNMFLPKISDKSSSSSSENSPFSFEPLIEAIPYVTRSKIYREILKFREGKFPAEKPECQVVFGMDFEKPANNFIKADVVSPAFSYGGFDIKSINATMSLKGYKIFLEKLYFSLPDGGTVKIDGMFDLLNDTITGKADLNVMPEELSRILKKEEFSFSQILKFKNKPLSVSARLQDFSLSSMIFNGFLKIKVPEAEIKGMNVYDLNAQLFVNEKRVSATQFSLKTKKNSLQGQFDYYIKSGCFDIQAKANGSPVLFKKILHGDNKKLVLDILDRFRFPEKQKDLEIIFRMHAVFDKKPFYFLDANISMNDFEYSGVHFDSGATKIYLDSDSLFLLPAMTLQQKDSLTTFSMVYDNTKKKSYPLKSSFFSPTDKGSNRFLAEINGNMPGDDLLKCIFNKWDNEALNLSFPTQVKAHGLIDFQNINNTLFLVEIINSDCQWYDIKIKKYNADLFFKGFDMLLRNARGKVYDGDIVLNYVYNFESWKGTLELDVDKANFPPLAKIIGGDFQEQDKGKLSFTTKNSFYYDKDDNLFINGKGKLWIRDADLWDIPIINEFGELTKKWIGRDWGNISKLDADLEFKKDHIYSDNIHTDGTVVSLSGKGKYYWSNDDYDFTIRAKLLESALPFNISEIFNPLSWLLETRVYRKDNEVKWEQVHSVKRLFKK